MKNILLKTLLLLLFVLITGCGGGKNFVSISLKSYDNSNGGNAVVVTIYQLTNADKFSLSSFESLTKNLEGTLGSDLISNSTFEKTMVPGESFKLDELEIKKEAAYLGIIADFHTPSADAWRQVVSLNKSVDKVVISVLENSISVKVEN
jgi:type VI secretion system VasD/TssJ family lipoprotein